MEFNLKNLIKESLSVLLEGRLEDVKAKYSDISGSEIVIDNLSQGDPSGNNKYLDWMAKISFQDKADTSHIVGLVTDFHSNFSRLTSQFTTPIVDSNKEMFPGRAENSVKNNPKDINSYPTLKSLKLIVDALEETKKERPDRDRIYQDERWTVIVPKSHPAACKYGVHSNWCVSTSNSGYFDRYTKERAALLFFIIWRKKRQETDKTEYKVAINAKFKDWHNPHEWDWYDMPDHTQDPNLMLNVFPTKMVETIQRYLVKEGKAQGKIVDEKSLNKLIKDNTTQLVGTTNAGRYFFTNNVQAFSGLENYDYTMRYEDPEDVNRGYAHILISPTGEFVVNDVSWIEGRNDTKNLVGQYNSWLDWGRRYKSFFHQVYNLNDDTVVNPELKQAFDTRVKQLFGTIGGMWSTIRTSELSVGDKVRWKKGRGWYDQRNNQWNESTIDRQTPSGFFVTGKTDEFPKGKRFQPSANTRMDKWVKFDESLDLDKKEN